MPPTEYESVIRVLNQFEGEEMVMQFHRNIYEKSLNFESDKVNVKMISPSLYNELK